MTKTWDPNRKTKMGHWRRPAKKKKRIVWDDIARRNAYVYVARRYARFEKMDPKVRADLVATWAKRANKFAPLSERQINGLIVLCGRGLVDRMNLPVEVL